MSTPDSPEGHSPREPGAVTAGAPARSRGPAPVLAVSGLRVVTPDGADIVADFGLEVAPGEIVAVVGETGSGKTTAATALLGHTRAGARVSGGRIVFDGVDVTEADAATLRRLRGRRAAYVPQDPATALNPALRVGTHLDEVLRIHEPGLPRAERRARIADVLDEVGLPRDRAFLRRFPHQLSGGQQQRVLLALAFVLRPALIVLDEPTTALDVTTQARVLDTVRRLCRAHDVAAVYVSHDLAVVRALADRLVVLYAGRIVETAPTRELFARPRHPYTRGLLAAVPDVTRRRRLAAIPGHAPAPGEGPGGCAFAPRCAAATAQCRAEQPRPTPVGARTLVACHHPLPEEPDALAAPAAGHGPLPEEPARPPHAAEPARPPVPADPPLLEARDVRVAYGRHTVLDGVSLALRPGTCTALVGGSGAGKTTLARTLAGLGTPATGTLTVRGATVPWPVAARTDALRREVQYVFQNPYRALNPRLTVRQTLSAVLRHCFGTDRAETERRVLALLDRVALPARTAGSLPRELSGGERQRVAVARALACEPEVLICDEITSALDVSVQAGVLGLLRQLRSDGLAMLLVTHDLGVVRAVADDTAVLHRGRVIEHGPVDAVLDRPHEAYTRSLVAAAPRLPASADVLAPVSPIAPINPTAHQERTPL